MLSAFICIELATWRPQNGNVVLDSWLVSFHPVHDWKWLYYFPCLQKVAASKQNQRVCRFSRSGRLLCWLECFSTAFRLRGDNRMRPYGLHSQRGGLFQVAVYVCVCDKLVQFSPGSLHCYCEAVKLLDFYDTQKRFPDDFHVLDHSSCCRLCVFTKLACFWRDCVV